MKVGLLIDPIDQLSVYKDSSCRLAYEAQTRGASIFYFTLEDMFILDGVLQARGFDVSFNAKEGLDNEFSYLSDQYVIELSTLDVLLIRKDPPVTDLHNTALYMLEALRDEVLMVNDPVGIRNGHSKLQTLRFPDLCPEQLLSSNEDQLLDFINEHKDVIIKPLNGMGGAGVMRISNQGKNNKSLFQKLLKTVGVGKQKNQSSLNNKSLLETMTLAHGYPLLAQKFIKEAKLGEKRIFIFDGVACGAIIKEPAKDDFRGNISAGASVKAVELSESDKALCERLSPYLKEQGLFFVGLDVIGSYLIEINSISPGAISLANTVLETPLEKIFWDKMLEKMSV